MEDFREKIDAIIAENESRHLLNHYSNDIQALIQKMEDLKSFLSSSKSFDLDLEGVDEEEVKDYYAEQLQVTVKRFFDR